MSAHLVLHAPNVHTGGGLILLQEILKSTNFPIRWVGLDTRAKKKLHSRAIENKYYVKRSVLGRLLAEWRLWRVVQNKDVVLCFHGLAPLLPVRGSTVVFIQNRLLIEQGNLTSHPLFTRLRILVERFLLRVTKRNSTRYFVQTPSMATALKKYLGDVNITVLPFAPTNNLLSAVKILQKPEQKFDFVYVSSGEAHKNHVNLLEAWRLLSQAGLKPSLALTIDPQLFKFLCKKIENYVSAFSLNITNLGQLEKKDIENLYQSSSALIFPSRAESFGVPLIEASQYGLPILASELDYVRDVVKPAETFNPYSPTSISRAVKRFLGSPEPVVKIHSAEEFLTEVLK